MRGAALSAVLVAVAGAAGTAGGQVVPVGPFSGPVSEGFATQNTSGNPFPVCVADRVFGGTCDLCVPGGAAHISAGWAFDCGMLPNLTPGLFGGWGGKAVYGFDAAVRSFGGYFGTNFSNNVSSGAVARFIDGNGAQIGPDQQIGIGECGTYRWNGWTSTTPFKWVEIVGLGAGSGGGYIMMDDMEYQLGAVPPCFANCDGSSVAPVLNVNDFVCFQARYAAGDPGANCDGSTVQPILNVYDFICFQNRYAIGCP